MGRGGKSGPIALPPGLRHLRSDRDPHPGAPDMTRSRRNTAEVQAEQGQKKAELSSIEQNREDSVTEVAHLEHAMHRERAEKTRNANHPPTTTQKKVLRHRKETTVASQPATFLG